jgi:tetratricopeptide (TPR) repeat protein
MQLILLLAIGLTGNGPPPFPDLTYAEPQVRAAITEDHEAIGRDPTNARAWGRYAGRLAVHEYLLEAVDAWTRAQQLDPENYRWPYLTGVFLVQDDPDIAHAAFERAMSLNDHYPPLLVRWAAIMERRGRPCDAMRAYLRAVELAPRNAYAHAGLGARLLADGETATARRHFEKAVQIDGDCRPALAGLVTIYRLDGDLAEANAMAHRAADAPRAQAPDPVFYSVNTLSVSTTAVVQRAKELSESGRQDEAIIQLRTLVDANPDSARGHSALGDRLREQDQLPMAQRRYNAALALAPDLLPAQIGLATCLVRSRRFDEAIEQYNRTLADHPTAAEAHSGLAICLAGMGRHDLALEHFREAVRLAPDSRRSRVGYGRTLVLSGDFAAAVDVLQPVADTAAARPDELTTEAIALYGFALARTGRELEAVEPLRRALRVAPTRGDVRRELARILADTGHDRDAARLLRDGLALQPNGVRTSYALAWLLATSPDAEVRDGPGAVQLAERWLKAPGTKGDGSRLDILACAYAEALRFEDAQRTAERAIAMARKADQPEQAAAMTARLELFKQGRPYRAPQIVR